MTIELSAHQIAYLLGQVRMDLREHRKAIERMKRKFAAGYDGTEHDAKTEFIKEGLPGAGRRPGAHRRARRPAVSERAQLRLFVVAILALMAAPFVLTLMFWAFR